MNFYTSKKIQNEFDRNLKDWFLGGPKEFGWTRTGPSIECKNAKLTSYSSMFVSVDDVLAKNFNETERWHMNFLRNKNSIFNTKYYCEYLYPRYGIESEKRAIYFIDLLEDIKLNGIRKPIWLADVENLKIGFKYFRFNGCHRTCAAKFIGKKEIFSIVFKTNYNDYAF